ncbi:MAG: phosphoenolpyruvate--protein phosphotransferase [Phycisphaerae bacterium]|nr:phosphoenolpyruvate--protein phosphotransferase [Phycisphaerae bacterium]
MITKQGINVSPGVAIGPALVLDTEEYRIPRREIDATQVPTQIRTLDDALDASRQEVTELQLGATRRLGEKTAAIFAFHGEFIADQKLRAAVVKLIEEKRYTAAYAFEQVIRQQQRQFQSVTDPYLKERVRDLFDIQKRVLRHVLGRVREDIGKLTEPVIIVAHDISPSEAVSLDRERILGLAINVGGQTSHTAIIARMLGIPSVVALENITDDISGGETLIIDGTHGIVIANPEPEVIQRYRAQQREYREFISELRGLRDLPAETLDHTRVTLCANIELSEEAPAAIEAGAEGIGLYRTEFVFLAHKRLPTEEEQYEAFRAAVRSMGDRPIVFRTMDLGADKIPGPLDSEHDHNPVLGLRSLRYCMRDLNMFKTHLRALLRASGEGNALLMFPMITQLLELRQAKHILGDVMEDLDEEELPYRHDIPIGMMMETPAAAMMADAFVKEVSFISIGTNDLTQYTLAVDRANERVSHLYSPHNPAVLKLVREIMRAARQHDVPVSICGEMAGAPIYTQLLLGLGLREFSMAPKDIPEIKKVVRSTTLRRCKTIANKVLRFDAERQVLNYLRDELRKIVPETL